jgi:hypothetical protein
MRRVFIASSLLLAFAAISLGLASARYQAQGSDPTPQQAKGPNRIIQLAKKLNERVDYAGIDDPKTSLQEALDEFRDKHNLTCDVNDAAFEVEGIKDVMHVAVATKPIPRMRGVKLETALKRVLSRIPGTTYVIREDGVEIIPVHFMIMEFYGNRLATEEDEEFAPGRPVAAPAGGGGALGAIGGGPRALGVGGGGGALGAIGGGLGALGVGGGGGALGMFGGAPGAGGAPLPRRPMLPLIQAEFEKRPLEEALKELASSAQVNIVVSAGAAEKAKLPVTASLLNVPVDTAVRILADMADLKPVLIDRVLYVTTRENAARLQEELDRETGRRLEPTRIIGRGSQAPPMN